MKERNQSKPPIVAPPAPPPARTRVPQPTPIISRVLADGTLIETLHDAARGTTQLAIRAPSGRTALAGHYDLPGGQRLIPYSAANNLLTSGCVLLPSAIGQNEDKAVLLADIRAFIHRYVDLSSHFEDIAAHYVLLSWVHDAFSELPYLRFRGEYGTGKTRALLAIGSICYKPIFASGASSVSPIFRILDAFGGTLLLDEADLRFSDKTADLIKILNNGNVQGLPVLRTVSSRNNELHPQAFKVYGPKLIAMREGFADAALESRFLTEETGARPLRGDIAVHLPDIMKEEARDLRNRLLAWRFAARNSVGVDRSRPVAGLSPRGNQTVLALLSLIDDDALRSRLADDLVAGEARAAAERAASPRVTMAGVVHDLAATSPTSWLALTDVAATYNAIIVERGEQPLTVKAIGWLVRSQLGLVTMKTRGVYVIPQSERAKIAALALRYGLAADAATPGKSTA
ncbi:MAG TPA: hypothetical protein VN240_09700 [Propylenella sp.]|nr:hypothetical protein [Propylenella sp.]